MEEETKKNGSRAYRWVITTLAGLLCFSLGIIVQGERMRTQVVTNTVEIRALKEGFAKIEVKLDRILVEK